MTDFGDLFKDAPSVLTRNVLDGGPIGHYELHGPGTFGEDPVVIQHMDAPDVVIPYTGINPEKFVESDDEKSRSVSPLKHWYAYKYRKVREKNQLAVAQNGKKRAKVETTEVFYQYERPATIDDLREIQRGVR